MRIRGREVPQGLEAGRVIQSPPRVPSGTTRAGTGKVGLTPTSPDPSGLEIGALTASDGLRAGVRGLGTG